MYYIAESLGTARDIPAILRLEAFVGNATSGAGYVYEDDGVTQDYQDTQQSAITRFQYSFAQTQAVEEAAVDASGDAAAATAGGHWQAVFDVGAAEGSFHGMSKQRGYEVVVRCMRRPCYCLC